MFVLSRHGIKEAKKMDVEELIKGFAERKATEK